MTTVTIPSFEVRDNTLTAAEGHKLVALDRRGVYSTIVNVSDDGETVALCLGTHDEMSNTSHRVVFTPQEARALAGMLIEVAAFVEKQCCVDGCERQATLTAQRRWPEGAIDSQRLGFCEAHATSDLAFPEAVGA